MKKQWVIALMAGWTICCAGVEAGEVKALADRVRTYQLNLGLKSQPSHMA